MRQGALFSTMFVRASVLTPAAFPLQVIACFLKNKTRQNTFQLAVLHPGAEEVALKDSRAGVYGTGRNRVDVDGTSHISYVGSLRLFYAIPLSGEIATQALPRCGDDLRTTVFASDNDGDKRQAAD